MQLGQFKKLVPLLMILCTVSGSYLFFAFQHHHLDQTMWELNSHHENIQAEKELGQWLAADLERLAKLLNSSIISKDKEQQHLFKKEMFTLIEEMNLTLDTLAMGGEAKRSLPLNLPNKLSGSYLISYQPEHTQSYNLAIRTLRSQLIELKKIIEEAIEATTHRNLIFSTDDFSGIRDAALEIVRVDQKAEAHIQRMTESANRLVYETFSELQQFKDSLRQLQQTNSEKELVLSSLISLAVLLLIILSYRQILQSHNTLGNSVQQLQQTEAELQKTNAEIKSLNENLEKQVLERTQNLQRYEQIVSTDSDLIAFFDTDHRYLAVNKRYVDYFGAQLSPFVGKHISQVIGREFYENKVKELLDYCLDGEIISFFPNFIFPAVGKRQVKTTFTPYRASNGEISGIVARVKDVTEIAKQEANLRLYAQIFESTTEGIIITDPEAKILTVNPAFSQITGYSEQEVLGHTPLLLQSDRHDQNFYRILWQSLRQDGKWQGEIWNQRKNGDVYPEWLTINAIHDESGQLSNYVAVCSDISTTKKAMEALEHQAHHHPLTKLPNRLLLHARLKHSIQKALRERQQGAVFYLDLDNFKNVNDSLGHTAGDQVLLEVAKRLQEKARETDTVAHLSGDEFVVVMDRLESSLDAVNCAGQILEKLQDPIHIQEYQLYLSASLGITVFPQDGTTVENLLKNSDAAMYKAKEAGKNRYHIYSPELTEAALERVSLESYLRQAQKKDELILHYQPQIDLKTGRIVAFEALLRWQHPQRGLIPPNKFISLTEETGLIIDIGEWVLRTACKQLLAWRHQGYEIERIAVNLSGRQIQQKDLHLKVAQVLEETGCPPDSLELEITEGFIMQHPEQSIAVLGQIRKLGVELSVDDFGTGHSSLNYLKRLPITRLKVDRSFVADIFADPEDEAITKAIIALGHGLNLQITAEGIETERQRKFLCDLGCNEGQGFLISRPLPADQVCLLLTTSC